MVLEKVGESQILKWFLLTLSFNSASIFSTVFSLSPHHILTPSTSSTCVLHMASMVTYTDHFLHHILIWEFITGSSLCATLFKYLREII